MRYISQHVGSFHLPKSVCWLGLLLVMPLLAGECGIAVAEEGARSLINDVIAYRNKIGTCRFEVKITHPEDNRRKGGATEIRLDVWNDFNKNTFRCDRRVVHADGIEGARQVNSLNCGFEGLFLSYFDFRDGRLPVATFGEGGNPEFIPRFRLLGILPTGFKELHSHDLERCPWLQFLQNAKVEPVQKDQLTRLLGDSSADNEDLRIITSTSQMKLAIGTPDRTEDATVNLRLIVDLKKGPSILFIEQATTMQSLSVTDSSCSILENWGGYWYPKQVLSHRFQGGDLRYTEKVEIESAAFNAVEEFDSLRAIGLAQGALVRGAPGFDQASKWDGNKLVRAELIPVGVASAPIASEKLDRNPGLSKMLVVNVGVIVVLAMLIAVRWYKMARH